MDCCTTSEPGKIDLILPQLKGNLASLSVEEERIRSLSLLEINGSEDLRAHLEIVHASMDVLHALTVSLTHRSDDDQHNELAIIPFRAFPYHMQKTCFCVEY